MPACKKHSILLFLFVFSCRSAEPVVEDEKTIICRAKLEKTYEKAEGYFWNKEYDRAKWFYKEALSYDCLYGLKTGSRKNKVTLEDEINARLNYIHSIEIEEREHLEKVCTKLLKLADTLYAQKKYEDARDYYDRYKSIGCVIEDKEEYTKKLNYLDSLIKAEKK